MTINNTLCAATISYLRKHRGLRYVRSTTYFFLQATIAPHVTSIVPNQNKRSLFHKQVT